MHSRARWAAWLAVAASLPTQLGAADDACDVRGVARVVAVGDVHGAYENFVGVLRMSGLVDDQERWTGGRAHLVQTGDVLDRGPDSRKALELLMRLEKEASKAGGRVHALLGNHEAMRMQGDRRYVNAGEYEAFRTPESEKLREEYYRAVAGQLRKRSMDAGEALDEAGLKERFYAEAPLGLLEMREAFGPQGRYGRWLRGRDTMVRIDGVVFLHGGISPAVAPLGCQAINKAVRRELNEVTAPGPADRLSTRPDGPLWYRGLAQEDEAALGPAVEEILKALAARAIVVGHTPTGTGRIRTRFDGRVVMIDAGMLPSFGGHLAALEVDPKGMTALYPDGRVPLGPAQAARRSDARRQVALDGPDRPLDLGVRVVEMR
ncbi:MAG TPA: metallophosphoesterase [Vicinamibacteria bacterium]|nr:metallophosphoesterase [Vicinamibacteria bacterium]